VQPDGLRSGRCRSHTDAAITANVPPALADVPVMCRRDRRCSPSKDYDRCARRSCVSPRRVRGARSRRTAPTNGHLWPVQRAATLFAYTHPACSDVSGSPARSDCSAALAGTATRRTAPSTSSSHPFRLSLVPTSRGAGRRWPHRENERNPRSTDTHARTAPRIYPPKTRPANPVRKGRGNRPEIMRVSVKATRRNRTGDLPATNQSRDAIYRRE
jgi:hypothetical protein